MGSSGRRGVVEARRKGDSTVPMRAAAMLASCRAASMASAESAVQPIKMRRFNQPIPSTAEHMVVVKAKSDQKDFLSIFSHSHRYLPT